MSQTSSILKVEDLPRKIQPDSSGYMTTPDSALPIFSFERPYQLSTKRTKIEAGVPRQSGNLFIWGSYEDVTDLEDQYKPRKTPFPVEMFKGNLVQVACGGQQILVLTDDGRVYSWGFNENGELGRRTDSASWKDVLLEEELADLTRGAIPGEIKFFDAFNKVVQISAGEQHSAALLEDGVCLLWGAFYSGQSESRIAPKVKMCLLQQVVKFKSDTEFGVVKICSGGNHLLMLTDNGEVWGVGYCECGQLGNITEDVIQEFSEEDEAQFSVNEWQQLHLVTVPIKLKVPEPVVDIFVGKNSSFILCQSGRTYACGQNEYGQLGLGRNSTVCVDETQMQQVYVDETQMQQDVENENNQQQIQQVYVDETQMQQDVENENNQQQIQQVYVDETQMQQDVENENNQQQTQHESNQLDSTQMSQLVQTNGLQQGNLQSKQTIENQQDRIFEFQEGFKGISMKQISSGHRHTLGLSQDGKIYVCGSNQDGRLGLVDVDSTDVVEGVYEPRVLERFLEENRFIVQVVAGDEYSGCVDNEGQGYLWGQGADFKLANNNEDDNVLQPRRMVKTRKFQDQQVLDISLGYSHGAVISISNQNIQQ
eukprot:TRINITY_DN694_c0_g1_i5.p1 TRINITY_DN694_c0_g1~~TRINITY_DN694_c0_g1_i5.p1  ORF type:complete len:595 (-),score=83.30 TRINITY_DN694_c0_g1_i5:331-2115(-)